VVWVQTGVFLVFAVIKVALIMREASLIVFAYGMLAEAIIASALLLAAMGSRGLSVWCLGLSFERARTLLKDSWPLMFMALMLGLYTKIDILMVNYFLGDRHTGIYSVATGTAELWFFSVVILVNSTYPALIQYHENSPTEFTKRLFDLYALSFWGAVIFSATTFLLSEKIFSMLYGGDYLGAANIFNIYVWSGIFVFMITASSRFFLLKNHSMGLLYRATGGAVINISLNYFLLPRYHLEGAAIATLISYFFVAYCYDFFDPKARVQLRYKFMVIFYPLLKNKIFT
jgi:PST family polysaccharide transporter